jgi:hypothetical protein
MRRRWWWCNVLAIMRECEVVATAEAIAIVVLELASNWWVTELSSLLDIRWIVIVKVVVGGFEAIAEALALNVAELMWRRIPTAAIMVGVIPVLPILSCQQNGHAQ